MTKPLPTSPGGMWPRELTATEPEVDWISVQTGARRGGDLIPRLVDGLPNLGALNMDQDRSRQLVAGSIVVSAIASIAVGIGSLSGFSNAPAGNSMAAPMSGEALAILFVGTLIILGLERVHLSGHQAATRARAARAARAALVALAANETTAATGPFPSPAVQ